MHTVIRSEGKLSFAARPVYCGRRTIPCSSSLRNRETKRDDFVFFTNRLACLVMEHALSLLPFEVVVRLQLGLAECLWLLPLPYLPCTGCDSGHRWWPELRWQEVPWEGKPHPHCCCAAAMKCEAFLHPSCAVCPFSELGRFWNQHCCPYARTPHSARYSSRPMRQQESRRFVFILRYACCKDCPTPSPSLQLHFLRLPSNITDSHVILMDATVATGAAAIMAIRVLLVRLVPYRSCMAPSWLTSGHR